MLEKLSPQSGTHGQPRFWSVCTRYANTSHMQPGRDGAEMELKDIWVAVGQPEELWVVFVEPDEFWAAIEGPRSSV